MISSPAHHTTMARFAQVLLLAMALHACGSPVAVIDAECGIAPGGTCLCADGTYKPLLCAPDGSIYCDCATPSSIVTTQDARADLDASDHVDTSEDLDMEPPDMITDAARDLDMPDMPDGECELGQICPVVDCDDLFGNARLPELWSQRTIGFLPEDRPVEYGYANGQVCMRAAGDNIWMNGDRFFYVSREIDGEFDLSVKIDSLNGGESSAKLGVMFRTSDDPEAPFTMLQLTRSDGASMRGRSPQDRTFKATFEHVAIQAPHWMRMIRRADTFYGYVSSDGQSWQPLGALDIPDMPDSGHLGFALASQNPTMRSTTSLSEIILRDTQPQEQCPADIACDEVLTQRGIDIARKSGLDLNLFTGPDVDTFTVTRADGQSVGTLHDALLKADQRAKQGFYSIIEVDTAQVTTPIEILSSGSPRAANVWIRGNGAIIQNATSNSDALLTLDEHVIVEGFRFRRSRRAIQMYTEGDVSTTRRTGIWLHHNSFDGCSVACIWLRPTLDEARHITISHNTFGTQSTTDIAAINAADDCNEEVACLEREDNLWLSVHHNFFAPTVTSSYPKGGARIIYYDNVIEEVSTEGLDLRLAGQIISHGNLFGSTQDVQVFQNGAGIHSKTDIFLGSAKSTSDTPVDEATHPDYFTAHDLVSEDEFSAFIERVAGPPDP